MLRLAFVLVNDVGVTVLGTYRRERERSSPWGKDGWVVKCDVQQRGNSVFSERVVDIRLPRVKWTGDMRPSALDTKYHRRDLIRSSTHLPWCSLLSLTPVS